jgi:hypothetical protein
MKNTSTKPLMPMMYFFPREEHQIFIKKFMKPVSGIPQIQNLSPEGCRVKPAPPYLASIRSADFQVPLHKPARFKEFGTLIHANNAVGISRTTDATVGGIIVLYT